MSPAQPFSTGHHLPHLYNRAHLARKTRCSFRKWQLVLQANTQTPGKQQATIVLRLQAVLYSRQDEKSCCWSVGWGGVCCTHILHPALRSFSSLSCRGFRGQHPPDPVLRNWLSHTGHTRTHNVLASRWLVGHRWALQASLSPSPRHLFASLQITKCLHSPHRESYSHPSDLSPKISGGSPRAHLSTAGWEYADGISKLSTPCFAKSRREGWALKVPSLMKANHWRRSAIPALCPYLILWHVLGSPIPEIQ